MIDDERDGRLDGATGPLGYLGYLGQFLHDVGLALVRGLVMPNHMLGRAPEMGRDTESFRHRPESGPYSRL